jgi:sugar phosphate permease
MTRTGGRFAEVRRRDPTLTLLVRFAVAGAVLVVVGLAIALAMSPTGWILVAVGLGVLVYGPVLIALWSGRDAGKPRAGATDTGYQSLLGFVLALIEKSPADLPDRTRQPRTSSIKQPFR